MRDYSHVSIEMKSLLRHIYEKANNGELDKATDLANDLAMKSLELIAALKSQK
jgi:hypothetical protein